MEREGFLKSLFTLIAAPSLIGEIEIKPFVKEQPQIFNADIIKFYSTIGNNFRLGDLIVSDMGDKAMITSIFINNPQVIIEARPICRGQYRYKKLESVIVLGRMIPEYGYQEN